MQAYLLVALGGALGSVARFAIGLAAAKSGWDQRLPASTIGINVLGSFVIGAVATMTAAEGAWPATPGVRAFVMVGLCGGFTTFSSFSLQTLILARGGAWIAAAANVVLSVLLCLAAVTLGHVAAQRLGAD